MHDIERISSIKEKHILVKLKKILEQMSLNETGGILIFDCQGKIIIHTTNLTAVDFIHSGSTLNKSMQERLEKAAGTPGKSVEYLYGNKREGETIQIAYVDYYRYMNWYVAAYVDGNELERPVSAIAARQSVIILIVALVGIVVAVFVSKKIAYPLALLTQYSRDLPNSDFGLKENPVLGTLRSNNNDEIKQLADAFAFMESALGRNIRDLEKHQENLEELVNIRTEELLDANKNPKGDRGTKTG